MRRASCGRSAEAKRDSCRWNGRGREYPLLPPPSDFLKNKKMLTPEMTEWLLDEEEMSRFRLKAHYIAPHKDGSKGLIGELNKLTEVEYQKLRESISVPE